MVNSRLSRPFSLLLLLLLLACAPQVVTPQPTVDASFMCRAYAELDTTVCILEPRTQVIAMARIYFSGDDLAIDDENCAPVEEFIVCREENLASAHVWHVAGEDIVATAVVFFVGDDTPYYLIAAGL